MAYALFRSKDSVHLLLHHRVSAPMVIQTTFGPWDQLGWVEPDELDEPLRLQVLNDMASQFFAVVPADEVPAVTRVATSRGDRRR